MPGQNTLDIQGGIFNDPIFSKLLGFTAGRIIGATIRLSFVVISVVSFLFLLWGSLQWIMAGGDKEGIDKAKKKISGALIGLIIALSVYAIARLSETIFGVNIFRLTIPSI